VLRAHRERAEPQDLLEQAEHLDQPLLI
jgi:hypothetical protein